MAPAFKERPCLLSRLHMILTTDQIFQNPTNLSRPTDLALKQEGFGLDVSPASIAKEGRGYGYQGRNGLMFPLLSQWTTSIGRRPLAINSNCHLACHFFFQLFLTARGDCYCLSCDCRSILHATPRQHGSAVSVRGCHPDFKSLQRRMRGPDRPEKVWTFIFHRKNKSGRPGLSFQNTVLQASLTALGV